MASHRNTLFCYVSPHCMTQFPWVDLPLPEVCSDTHAAFFESAWRLYNQISFCIDDSIATELVPTAFLDVRTSCCIIVFIDVSSSHSLAMCSTCLLFDFHSDPCRLHLILLHELRFPVISPSNNIGLFRGMIFASECTSERIRSHSTLHRCHLNDAQKSAVDFGPFRLWPIRSIGPVELAEVEHPNNQLTHQDVLDLSPIVCLVFFVPCRHVSPAKTP